MISQVPGSYERVGLPSELPATERAHFEDKLKQLSGHKVQVNSRTVILKFYSNERKVITYVHLKTAEIPDLFDHSNVSSHGVSCGFICLFVYYLLRAGSIAADYRALQISSRFLDF